MADRYEIWTHGVNVVAQDTPHLTNKQNGLFMMPLSWGTVVRQNPGTDNWFHLPIPTPTHLDDWNSWNQHGLLRVKIPSHAAIDKIQIYSSTNDTANEKFGKELTKVNFDPELRNREEELTIDINDHIQAVGPLVMSVHVNFDGDGSVDERTVTFIGSGASFKEAGRP
jgi:hypothetical protein